MTKKIISCISFVLLFYVSLIGVENVTGVFKEGKAFESFTGKVVGNGVRIRLQPDIDSYIVKEVDKDELLLVVGEDDHFYMVRPPNDIRAYVFRTYVLDNMIEGNNVNVRLKPDLNSPVITQLNSMDSVKGSISTSNSKWLEIDPPASTVFYVSKDYIVNIGSPDILQDNTKKQQEAKQLLSDAYLFSQAELKKTFQDIDFKSVKTKFEDIINNYQHCTKYVKEAKKTLEQLKEAYIQKKLIFLEDESCFNVNIQSHPNANIQPHSNVDIQPEVIVQDDFQIINQPTDKMLEWQHAEGLLFNEWLIENPDKSIDDFYNHAKENLVVLTGTIEAFSQPVKNKPGDFILRGNDGLPIAYLYSTQVNLQEKLGNRVTLILSPRPNKNFAFPAFYVLGIE